MEEKQELQNGVTPEQKGISFIKLSTVLWLLYFTIGLGVFIYSLIVPPTYSITLGDNNAIQLVLFVVSATVLKYIWILSITGYYFSLVRDKSPKFFGFIFTAYTIALVLSIVGLCMATH